MGEPLYDAGRGQRRRRRPAVPHLRAGGHARDAARLPRAPAARERRELVPFVNPSPTRTSRSRSWSRDLVHTVAPHGRARRRRLGRRTGDPLPRGLFGRRASTSRPGPGRRAHARSTGTVLRRHGDAGLARRADAARRRRRPARGTPVLNPPTATTVSARPRTTTAADVRPRRRRRNAASRPGRRRRAAERALPEAAAAALEADTNGGSCRCSCARPARPAPTPSPRCARRSTSCATTPPRSADFDNATHVPLRPGGLHQPMELPLAIFTGQVAAALAAKATSCSPKPAEQTPLSPRRRSPFRRGPACRARRCSCCRQRARRWARLVADARVNGVLFTGSTEVARLLQRTLGARTAQAAWCRSIAETGGQNAMIVDSSALAEQTGDRHLASAFDSAGQRCSALRLLAVQDDVADRLLAMLDGALRELRVGDPRLLATDVGPVIDAEAAPASSATCRRCARTRPARHAPRAGPASPARPPSSRRR